MSDRSGNSGHPSLGDTAAAVLQGTYEATSAITDKLLRPVAILLKTVASGVQPLLCVFKKSKCLQASKTSSSTQLLLYLPQVSILRSDGLDFNC